MSNLLLHKVCKYYNSVCAIDNVSLSVPTSGRTAIVGPSGSGKTTLLRMIAGFEFPDSGHILLGDKLLSDSKKSVPAYQREIGYVMQDGALFPHLRIGENIAFGLTSSTDTREIHVRKLIKQVQLDQTMLQRWPHELSGGQQQRVALARSFALKPRLMLLDEPFSSLDMELRASLRKTVMQCLREEETTAVLVTHDQIEALSFADQLAVMREGRLVQIDSPDILYWRPIDVKTASFLGQVIILQATLINGRAECILGNLPIDNLSITGSRNIMLRPEQITLNVVISSTKKDNNNCIGVVIGREFGGLVCSLTIAVNDNIILPAQCLSIDAPSFNSRVHVSVKGAAHVFENV